MKTGKTSKIDRITNILEGRKDSKFEHNGHAGGLTNKEKLRKKNFVMVRKGKKSVNNKTRKAAGLDRHEKNSAVRTVRAYFFHCLFFYFFIFFNLFCCLLYLPIILHFSISFFQTNFSRESVSHKNILIFFFEFLEGTIWPRQEEEKESLNFFSFSFLFISGCVLYFIKILLD